MVQGRGPSGFSFLLRKFLPICRPEHGRPAPYLDFPALCLLVFCRNDNCVLRNDLLRTILGLDRKHSGKNAQERNRLPWWRKPEDVLVAAQRCRVLGSGRRFGSPFCFLPLLEPVNGASRREGALRRQQAVHRLERIRRLSRFRAILLVEADRQVQCHAVGTGLVLPVRQ